MVEPRNDNIKYEKVIKFKSIKAHTEWDRKKTENTNVMVNLFRFYSISLQYNKAYVLIACNTFVNIFKFH